MPFTEDQLDDYLREVYASAPTEEVLLFTLELRHPAFVDDDDNPVHLRIVSDNADHDCKLEASAPVDAGEIVTFRMCPFNVERPEQSDQALPEATLTIDNVARELIPQLDRAIETTDPVEIVYREYLLSRKAIGPSFIVKGLQAKRVTVSTFRVSAKVGFADLVNARFPLRDYSVEEHRGLAR